MKIDIFDVGHGACSAISEPTGKRIMLDCGHRSDEPYWWPSIHFRGERCEALILSNLDEDHVSDFGNVWDSVPLGTIWVNPTLSAPRLKMMKTDGMDSGVAAVHRYLCNPVGINLSFNFAASVTFFYNSSSSFTDTNNLSLVTFVEYAGFSIIYPGDLEVAGWKALLQLPNFRSHLGRVKVFMTSHHGRENGCCEDVFAFCRPDVFVISDKEKQHGTQETTDWYKNHAKGIPRQRSSIYEPLDTRYVFTTRSDGCITIDVNTVGGYLLTYASASQSARN